MAERLKDSFGPDVPVRIAEMVAVVEPDFPADVFVAAALDGYEPLELMDRARAIAHALAETLPSDYTAAVDVLVRSMGPPLERTEGLGMAPFLYMPYVLFVAEHGLEDFDASMAAQHTLTQRFTCEFSIRSFLAAEQERTLAVLEAWTRDPSVHVRRLVSEGTRPRLPWAPRLQAFVADPRPILPLLDALKDDPEEYVRRSVANNLNDISKDHPDLAIGTATDWLPRGASDNRRRLVRHGLRTLTKAGNGEALEVLGFRRDAPVGLERARVDPTDPAIGESVLVSITLANRGERPAPTIADLRVWFVKANGAPSAKVFRLGEAEIAAGDRLKLRKRVSLRQHSTRTHHPGTHRIEVLINGSPHEGPEFVLGEA